VKSWARTTAPTMDDRAIPFGSAYGIADAHACRALRHAVIVATDEAFMDVVEAAAAIAGGTELTSARFLPDRYRHLYDFEFMKYWTITLGVMGFKLAQARPLPISCLAEGLALHSFIRTAEQRAEEFGTAVPALDGLWPALGSAEFLTLFDPTATVPDGLHFDRWFAAFDHHTSGVSSPFCWSGPGIA
jgi:hypothetical protein